MTQALSEADNKGCSDVVNSGRAGPGSWRDEGHTRACTEFLYAGCRVVRVGREAPRTTESYVPPYLQRCEQVQKQASKYYLHPGKDYISHVS